MEEVKYVYQPIKISLRENTIEIHNQQFFGTTETLEFDWCLTNGDGKVLGSGLIELPLIEPQKTHKILLVSCPWYSLWRNSAIGELTMSESTRLEVERLKDSIYIIKGDEWEMEFNSSTGVLQQWKK